MADLYTITQAISIIMMVTGMLGTIIAVWISYRSLKLQRTETIEQNNKMIELQTKILKELELKRGC